MAAARLAAVDRSKDGGACAVRVEEALFEDLGVVEDAFLLFAAFFLDLVVCDKRSYPGAT